MTKIIVSSYFNGLGLWRGSMPPRETTGIEVTKLQLAVEIWTNYSVHWYILPYWCAGCSTSEVVVTGVKLLPLTDHRVVSWQSNTTAYHGDWNLDWWRATPGIHLHTGGSTVQRVDAHLHTTTKKYDVCSSVCPVVYSRKRSKFSVRSVLSTFFCSTMLATAHIHSQVLHKNP